MASEAVLLSDVAAATAAHVDVDQHGEAAVSAVHFDSRRVEPGSLYVAFRGARADGHDFISAALEQGATAVLVDREPAVDTPYLLVEDTRDAAGWAAAAVYGHPANRLGLVGITGTNGKTTVAHMMAPMAAATGRELAVIGTVSANLDDIAVPPRTTPEASDLQRILRELVERGRITEVAVEVSSHAMEMGRVNGTAFDVVAFTNLSQDHLDYHHTMEEYYQAKARLFTDRWAPQAVIWVDDDWGARLADETTLPVTTVGTSDDVDIQVTYVADSPAGSTFTIRIDEVARTVTTSLAGRFNVSNAAIALACAHLQNWDIDASISGLATMEPIPGRYNTIPNDRSIWVVVDYAHTPDAIESIITETRSLVDGRIIAMVGAGGDRDQEKRPLMGRALTTADVAIVTTDNPRSENPEAILDQVMSGTEGLARAIPDRRQAISTAISMAEPGDAVLILGKGHETGQEFATETLPFDDAQVAAAELAALGAQR